MSVFYQIVCDACSARVGGSAVSVKDARERCCGIYNVTKGGRDFCDRDCLNLWQGNERAKRKPAALAKASQ